MQKVKGSRIGEEEEEGSGGISGDGMILKEDGSAIYIHPLIFAHYIYIFI